MHAYRQLRLMCREIKAQLCDGALDSEDTQSIVSTDTESLNGVVTELRDTLHCAIEQVNQVTDPVILNNKCLGVPVRHVVQSTCTLKIRVIFYIFF